MTKRSAVGGTSRGRGQSHGRRSQSEPTTTTTATATVTFVERLRYNSVAQQGSTTANAQTKKGAKLTPKQVIASRVYNLSLDVAALQQQLQQLTLHRSLLQTRALYTQRDADGSAVKTTAEYWRVFSRGFQAADPRQPAFLESVMDDALQLGLTRLGRAELLQQWELYTEYFAIRRYEVHTARVISTEDSSGRCITRSDGVFTGSFTRQGLEMVFPAVLQDPDLTQRLLGTELVTPVAFVLHFTEDGSIVRHDGEADFFHALQQAMGSLTQAAAILEDAQLAEEAMVRRRRDSNARETRRRRFVALSEEEQDEEEKAGSDTMEYFV